MLDCMYAIPSDANEPMVDNVGEQAPGGFICHPINFPALLTTAECERILALASSGTKIRAGLERPVEGYRTGHTKLIALSDSSRWLYERISNMFVLVNQWYRFDITGFVDSLLYCEYPADGHFDWHLDCGEGPTSTRKISLSLQLADPETYLGGALEFAGVGELRDSRKLGTAIAFPAFVRHRVAPVTQGVRRSLVAWAHGPRFR